MSLPRTPLLLLEVALESFVLGALCGSLSHSLSYFYLHLPEPSKGLPQFSIRGYLDDQPINRFDSLTWKMEPLVPWMEEVEKENFLAPGWVFRADLEKLSKLGHRAGGLHTWQVVLGCELMEDGSKGGFLHYGYDGMDFISFDKETLRWVAAQPQAQKLKRKWEDDSGWSEGNKDFLEEICIEWLQRYLSYRNKTLQRIEPPVGKVTCKEVDDHLEVLICQAFGFYPKEIQATWTRDGEVCEYGTLSRNVAPNSDGTYYIWLSIEIDPKERDRYRCRLEHQGLQEPLILAFKEETDALWLMSVGTAILIFLVFGIVLLEWSLFGLGGRTSDGAHISGVRSPRKVIGESLEKPTILPQKKIREVQVQDEGIGGRGPMSSAPARTTPGDRPKGAFSRGNWTFWFVFEDVSLLIQDTSLVPD